MDFEVKCSVCGNALYASWETSPASVSRTPYIDVDPCAPCMDEAKLEAAESARAEND